MHQDCCLVIGTTPTLDCLSHWLCPDEPFSLLFIILFIAVLLLTLVLIITAVGVHKKVTIVIFRIARVLFLLLRPLLVLLWLLVGGLVLCWQLLQKPLWPVGCNKIKMGVYLVTKSELYVKTTTKKKINKNLM